MTKLINGRTPAQDAAWNRWHLLIAIVLALLLLLLWLAGRGPGHAVATGSCCGVAAPAVVAPVAPAAEPAALPPAAADADGDGVTDEVDRCPDTPRGDRVGEHGCSCDLTVQLQYELDSDKLTPADVAELDRLAARLNELKFVGGEVGGYADSSGDDDYNLKLSQARAQSALDYLVSKGVAPGRMTAVGYGEANPIADNATAEGRALNRRVVLRRTDCGPAPGSAAPVGPIPAASLYFELDKFDLPADATGTLAPTVEYVKANPLATVAISGYHDPTGDREHNIELAKDRALAVRDYLMAQGIEEARFDMRKPIETTGSGSLEEARRVEVSVVQP
jgi:outer membrane protein OmpA-like peptidoglycan-associated protein